MAYGYTLTAAGRTLLLQLQAGNSMTISRIAVGDGEVPGGTNPATLTSLVHEVERSRATCTAPIVESDTLSFEVEYRNKWDDGTFGEDYTDPTGLTESFWLKEYAVFALDANENEVMLYYANLGDFPEAVAKWNGRNLVSKRYPVSISIVDDDTDVQLLFPANAFITSDYLEERLAAIERPATDAGEISYDDSVTQLGAANLQEAIEILARNSGNRIPVTIISENEPDEPGEMWLKPMGGVSIREATGGGPPDLSQPVSIADVHIGEEAPEDTNKIWFKPMGGVPLLDAETVQPLNITGAHIGENPPDDTSKIWFKPIQQS